MRSATNDIYLDANATCPVAPSHYDRVATLLKEVDGNPSSIHARGRGAKVALEKARASVAALLGARATEIIFTSGATEANNIAVQGAIPSSPARVAGVGDLQKMPDALRAGHDDDIRRHAVVSAAEHAAVREVAMLMAERGRCDLSVAAVKRDGSVDVEVLLKLVRPDTAFVAVMLANNEVGALNDVAAIATAVKAIAPQAHVHCDAVQGLGKVDMTWLAASAIDSASFSAHKVGAFKGVGALYLKTGVKLAGLMAGGGQERARRPGTENMPGIVSFGLICDELKARGIKAPRETQQALLTRLADIPGFALHGDPSKGLANTINFHVDGVGGDDLLLNLDLAGIQASSGSACSSGAARPSPVLLAMGYDEWVALNSVRLSWASDLPVADIDRVVKVISETSSRVRALSLRA
jgi:cysteine desulfurase